MKKKIPWWIFLIAAFFLLRFLVLWTGVERTCHYDELDLGTMAKEVLEGLKFPYRDYQLDFYSGESLILGALVIPFFKIMGMNLLAIKMVPLFFAFATLLLSYFFLKRNFGETAAKMGAWLLVLCPPGFVQLSLVGMSGHTEALPWSIAATAFFFEYLYGEGKRERNLWFAGILSGFAFWFYNANGIMMATCVLSWMILERKKFWGRGIFIFGAAFLIGFSPWFFSNFPNLYQGVDFFKIGFTSNAYGNLFLHALRKLAKLAFVHIPMSLAVEPALGIREHFLAYSYWLLFFVPVLVFSFVKKPRFLPLAIFPFLFMLVIGFLQFDLRPDFGFVGFRYLTPVLFWSLMAFAVLVSRLGNAGRLWWVVVLGLGLAGQTGLMFLEPPGRALQYQGFSYYQLAIRWQFSLVHRIHQYEDVDQLLAKFTPHERYYLYWGLSDAGVFMGEHAIFRHRIKEEEFLKRGLEPSYPFLREWEGAASYDSPLKDSLAKAASLPAEAREYFLKGWFEWWIDVRSIPSCAECRPLLTPEANLWAHRSLGRKYYYDMLDNLYSHYWHDLFYLFQNEMKRSDLDSIYEKLSALAPEERRWTYQGMGRARLVDGIYSNRLMIRGFRTFLNSVPAENRADVFWGLGWGIREMFREDALRAGDWIQALPAEGRAPALQGMHDFERWYRVPAS